MVKKKGCLLINYRTSGGVECSSKLSSRLCCKKMKNALTKRKLRQSIGGISTMNDYDYNSKWLRHCPYCKAKISMRKIFVDKIPYDLICEFELRTALHVYR